MDSSTCRRDGPRAEDGRSTVFCSRGAAAEAPFPADGSGAVKTFAPTVERDDAAVRETEDLLDRVYQGSVRMLVSALTRKRSVSPEELRELHAMLEAWEAEHHD